jgi:O-antigen ligase
MGQGPGTSTQGVAVVGATPLTAGLPRGSYGTYILDGRTFVTAEGGLAKTWLELGIMGVVLYGAVFWVALAPAVRSLRRLDGAGVALTILAIALGVVFLKGHQSLDDPLIQPLFWLSVGGIWGRARAVASVRRETPERGRGRSLPTERSLLPLSGTRYR